MDQNEFIVKKGEQRKNSKVLTALIYIVLTVHLVPLQIRVIDGVL